MDWIERCKVFAKTNYPSIGNLNNWHRGIYIFYLKGLLHIIRNNSKKGIKSFSDFKKLTKYTLNNKWTAFFNARFLANYFYTLLITLRNI